MLTFFVIFCLFASILSIIVGVFVYMKNPKRKLNIIWALMSLSVGLWGIGLALMASAHTGIEATSYLKWLHYFGAIFIPIFYFHFVTIILRVEHKNRLIIYLGYIICIFLQFMSFNGQLAGVRENIDIFRYYTVPKSFYLFFTVYFFGYVIYGIFLLFEYFLRAVGGTKHQIKYVLISSIIGFIGGSTTFLLVFDIPIHPFGVYFTFIYPILISYAITRYHLLDIRIAISRTVTFFLVYVPILSIPFLTGYFFKDTLLHYFGDLWWFLPIVLATILAPSGLYVYVKIQKQIERRLKAKKLEYLKSMEDFLDEVKHIRGLNDLVDLVVVETKRIMGVEKAWVYLVDSKWTEQITKHENKFEKEIPVALVNHLRDVGVPVLREELQYKRQMTDAFVDRKMRELGISVLVPAMHHDELVCVIVLGADGTPNASYDAEDIRAFNALGTNVALALKNAMYLEELNAAQADLIASERFAAIGRLATSAKHEINNPINVISGRIQNLLMDMKDKEDNFKDIRSRLKPMVLAAKRLMEKLKEEGTLFAGEGDIEKTLEIFDRAFKSLEERGDEEKSFKDKLDAHAKEIEDVQSFVLKAEEDAQNEKVKELIRELDLTLNTIQINLKKIKNWDKVLRDGLNMSYDHVKRITKVVEAIYHLPKETTGDIGPVSIREVIDESFEFTKYQTYWENVSDTTNEITIEDNLPKIKGVGSRIVSVISNIIINAYQAMTESGIKDIKERLVKIRANVAEDDKKYVEIGISNRGNAIDEKTLNGMFDRAFSSKGEGRGLGLYICKIQIEQFNEGKIYCQNIKGFGPEFVIRLPVYND